MPLNIESLDDEVIIDRSPAAPVRLNSYSPVATLSPDEYAGLVNVDTYIEGRIVTRRGTLDVTTVLGGVVLGLGYFKVDAAAPPTYVDNLVAVANTGGTSQFRVWDGSWHTIGAYNGSTTARVRMANAFTRIWVAQSGHALWRFDGTTMVAVPTPGPANVNPPVNPKFICVHTDRLICAGMTNLPNTLSMSKYLDGDVYDHTNWDMDVGNGDGDPIVGIVPWTNFNLVVLKEHSVWVVNCNPALVAAGTGNISGFTVTKVHENIGCLSGDSAVQVGADVFFLSDSGIRGVARTLASDEQNVVGPPLSEPITDLINRINLGAAAQIIGYYWKNRYILSVCLDSDTTPKHLIIWNTLVNGWNGYWQGHQPSPTLSVTAFTRRIVNGIPRMVMGMTNGAVVDFQDFVTEPNEVTATYQDTIATVASDYATEITSRAFNFGSEESLKTGFFGPIEFYNSVADCIPYVIPNSSDPLVTPTLGTNIGSVDLPLDLPFDLAATGILPRSIDLFQYGQWFHLQLRLTATAGKLSMNRLGVAAFMDTYLLQA